MNAKLLLKTIFLVIVALLLVLMGMNNKSNVLLSLPPLISDPVKLPAAIMYVSFFGVGFISGAVLLAGGGKKGGKAKPD